MLTGSFRIGRANSSWLPRLQQCSWLPGSIRRIRQCLARPSADMADDIGVMRRFRLGLWTNVGLVLIALLMFAATLLLFYGVATGKSG
jgi:hypothetical protein